MTKHEVKGFMLELSPQTTRPDPAENTDRVVWIDARGMDTDLRKSRFYLDIIGNQRDCRIDGLPGPYEVHFDIDQDDRITLAIKSVSDRSLAPRVTQLSSEFYSILRQRRRDIAQEIIRNGQATDDFSMVAANERRHATVQSGAETLRKALQTMGVATQNEKDCELARPLFEFMAEAYLSRMHRSDCRDIGHVASQAPRGIGTYGLGLIENADVKIAGEGGPYNIDIEAQLDATVIHFFKEGRNIEFRLLNSEWLPRFKSRLEWIDRYNNTLNAVPLNEGQMKMVDLERRRHHNDLANILSTQLDDHAPPIVVDFETARNLVGAVTDSMEENLRLSMGSGRSRG